MTLQPQVTAGLSASIDHVVTEDDTASSFRSGDVPVLATPRALALGEEATMAAIAGKTLEGHTSVGMRVSLEHLKATPIGGVVTASAIVERVEGRRITFGVEITNHNDEIVAHGKVVRVFVKRADFLASVPEVPTVSGQGELR